MPTFHVLDFKDALLIRNLDYSVEYLDNDGVGTATIVITGIGEYFGIIRRSFEIERPSSEPKLNPIVGDTISGSGAEPGGTVEVALPDGRKRTATVTADGDWSVTVTGATNAAQVTITMFDKKGAQIGEPVVLKTLVKVSSVKTQAKLYLVKGKTIKLPVGVAPYGATDKKVTWTSNKPKTVSVDPVTGKIKGLKIGTATLTVTTNDGAKTASCKVTVVKKTKAQKVKKLTIKLSADKNLRIGMTLRVTSTISPKKATGTKGIVVTYTSSNPKVAVVDGTGFITALSPGTTILTVKAGTKTRTFTVTVT